MLSTSKHLVSLALVFLFAIGVFAFSSVAQESDQKSGKASSGKVSLTGCLQKGDEPNEFSLTAEDGKLYGLRSSSVKLAEHLGHKVTVSGQIKPESHEKEEAKEETKEGKETGKKEAGDVQVSSVKMVSSSCQ